MSILKTKYFSGWGYTNPKGKDRKIKKLERTYIKGKRGVKLYYDSAHYKQFNNDKNLCISTCNQKYNLDKKG